MLERAQSFDEDICWQDSLLVTDDSRNIFALSSVLDRRA